MRQLRKRNQKKNYAIQNDSSDNEETKREEVYEEECRESVKSSSDEMSEGELIEEDELMDSQGAETDGSVIEGSIIGNEDEHHLEEEDGKDKGIENVDAETIKEAQSRVMAFIQTHLSHSSTALTQALADEFIQKNNLETPQKKPRVNKSTPKKRADNSFIGKDVFLVEKENDRFKCFVKGCAKDFLNTAGLVYHLKSVPHNLSMMVHWQSQHIKEVGDALNEPTGENNIASAAVHEDVMETSDDNEDDVSRRKITDMAANLIPHLDLLQYPIQITDSFIWFPGNVKPLSYPMLFNYNPELDSLPKTERPKPSTAKKWGKIYFEPSSEALLSDGESILELNPMQLKLKPFNPSGLVLLDENDPQLLTNLDTLPLFIDVAAGKKASNTIPLPFMNGTFLKEKDGNFILLNTGMSIWAMSWMMDKQGNAYLATAGQSKSETTLLGRPSPSYKSALQIWKFDSSLNATGENATTAHVSFRPAINLIHDFGCIHDISWFPCISEDKTRLGILAVSFGDGCTRLFDVPSVEFLSDSALDQHCHTERTFNISLIPEMTLFVQDTMSWKLAWACQGLLAIGCTNGFISCYDIKQAYDFGYSVPKPQHFFLAHSTGIRTLQWIQRPHESAAEKSLSTEAAISSQRHPLHQFIIVSTGYDGLLMGHDIRFPYDGMEFNRIRGFSFAMSAVPNMNRLVFADKSNTVKSLSIDDAETAKSEEEGTWIKFNTKSILVQSSTVFSLDISPHFPFVASASADGTMKLANYMVSGKSATSHAYTCYVLEPGPNGQNELKMSRVSTKERTTQTTLKIYDPRIAIQTVKWLHYSKTPGWLASGTASGLVRIELFGLSK